MTLWFSIQAFIYPVLSLSGTGTPVKNTTGNYWSILE